jgi:hypothetical protein
MPRFSENDWVAYGLCTGYVAGILDGISSTKYVEDGIVYEVVMSELSDYLIMPFFLFTCKVNRQN